MTLVTDRNTDKEFTRSINVWFVRGWNESDTINIEGTQIGTNLTPNDFGIGYTYELTPDYLTPGPTPGPYSILVLEKFQGFGVSILQRTREYE